MDLFKFEKRTQVLSERLQQIARRSHEGGPQDVLADPAFRSVLAAQERLLNAAEKLLERRSQAVAAI